MLEAGLLAHGNREDGSPFDFNAALQDLSPGTFGAASALPQLMAPRRGGARGAARRTEAAERPLASRRRRRRRQASSGQGGGESDSTEGRRAQARWAAARRGGAPRARSGNWRQPTGVSPGSLFAMLDGLDDRAYAASSAGDQAELKVGTESGTSTLLMPPPPPPPPRNTPATKTDPSSGLRVSSSDDWMSAYNSKASPPQMLLTEQLSPVHSPHLTDFLTTGF